MKKLIKILVGLILAVAVLALAGYLFIAIRGIPTYTPQKVEIKVEVTPARVEQGLKLASYLCIQCHSTKNGNQLTGRELSEMPPEFGEIHSANITQDEEHGIGKWTDGELIYFLRTGVRANGIYAPIWMPKFVHMSDEDLFSIVAYIRSSHPTVQPSNEVTIKCRPSWLSKFLCNVAFKPMPYPDKPIIIPDTNDLVNYGKYLVTGRYDCYQCHSADFKTLNVLEPEKSEGFLGGGNILITMDGKIIHTANITTDEKTGIGLWTYEQFAEAIRFGKKGDGTLHEPMIPYTRLDDNEVKAIWSYLHSVPKLVNEVDRTLHDQ